MSHISQINSTGQVHTDHLETPSQEAQLISRVRDFIGIELDHDTMDLYQRERASGAILDDELYSQLSTSGDDYNRALVHLSLRAFEGDLEVLFLLIEHYVEGEKKDYPKALNFFKLAMQYHTWASDKYHLIDEILVTVTESMIDRAETPEEKAMIPLIIDTLIDFANQGYDDVKCKLALLYLKGQNVPQNIDLVLQYFEDLWARDLTDEFSLAEVYNTAFQENEFAIDLLLKALFDQAIRGNVQVDSFFNEFHDREMSIKRGNLYEELRAKFLNSAFSNPETLDQNCDYLELIGDYKGLKRLARDGNPQACMAMANLTFHDSEKKKSYLLTAIEGGSLEALASLILLIDSLDDHLMRLFQKMVGDDGVVDIFKMLKAIQKGEYTSDFASRECISLFNQAQQHKISCADNEEDQTSINQLFSLACLYADMAFSIDQNQDAAYTLARIYAEGRVVKRNLERAFTFYFASMPTSSPINSYFFARYFAHSDQNSRYDEFTRLQALQGLDFMAQDAQPGALGVHFIKGYVAWHDQKDYDKALSFFIMAAEDALLHSVVKYLLQLGGHEQIVEGILQNCQTKMKAGNLKALNQFKAFLSLGLYDKNDERLYSLCCHLISTLLPESFALVDEGDPYALLTLEVLLQKSQSVSQLGIEPAALQKMRSASSRVYAAAMGGDLKAAVRYCYKLVHSMPLEQGRLDNLIDRIAEPRITLTQQGDMQAFSDFIALSEMIPELNQCALYKVRVNEMIENLLSFLIPLVENGKREFTDLVMFFQSVQGLDQNYFADQTQNVQNACHQLAENDLSFCFDLGFFYACRTRAQNLGLAKEFLEKALMGSNYQVDDREGLVQFYLKYPPEMRGKHALYFLGMEAENIEEATAFFDQAFALGLPIAYTQLFAYYADEKHQDLDKIKEIVLKMLQTNTALVWEPLTRFRQENQCVNTVMQQLIDEENRDAHFFLAHDSQLSYEERAEYLKKAAIKGHKFALGTLVRFLKHNTGRYDPRFTIAEVLFARNSGDPMIVDYLKNGVLASDEKAIELFLKLRPDVSLDRPIGQMMMGLLMIQGVFVPGDIDEGIAMLTAAAENGNHRAALMLGEAYILGYFDFVSGRVDVQENQEIAFNYLIPLTQMKGADIEEEIKASAHLVLGIWAYTADDENKNFQVAFQRFALAATLGSVKAQFYLGLCYYKGDGVPTDIEQAYQHIANAARTGFQVALDWLEHRANLENHVMIQDLLGDIYRVLGRYDKALAFYQKAADQGFVPALCSMAQIYEVLGLSHKVMPLYERAADAHYERSMEHVAEYYYEHEDESERNYHKAYLQYRFLSQNPKMPAEYSYRMGYILFHGLGHILNGTPLYIHALPAFKRAAKRGHVEAQFMVGRMYHEGLGTERNREKAIQYLGRAAEQGHDEAMSLLYRLETAHYRAA